MGNENDELLACFVEEATETLADIENDFLAIEQAGADIDSELVNRVFRGIHSMKGSAGFLGLQSIGKLAHESENVLNLIRNRELVPNSRVVDALLRSADALRNMVNNVESSNDTDVSEYITALNNAVKGDVSEEMTESLNRDIDISLPNGSLAFVMIKEAELVMSQRQGNSIYVIEVDLFADIQDKGRTPLDFLKKAFSLGELINSYVSTAGIKDLSSDLPDSMSLMLLFGSKLTEEELADALDIPLDKVHHIATEKQTNWEVTGPEEPADTTGTDNTTSSSAATTTKDTTNKEVTSTGPVEADSATTSSNPGGTGQAGAVTRSVSADTAKANKPANSSTKKASSAAQSTLRVHVGVIDTLMNLAGELVLGRNQLLQEADSQNNIGIESVAARIDQVTSELQEAIMQTRMQPIGTVFNKFPRIVRDLSSTLGKKCELVIEGKEVEMDKTIIEGISDPLTHLIRNSVDHGIETPEERLANGKPEQGTIVLKGYHQAGKVNISISDDGAGIDTAKLKDKAIEKGLITAEQAATMSQREAVNLIFHPGFSMAKKVTSVSGRGVGMDVVKTNIEKLGGTVEIDTQVGKGTNIIIKLPLTLAIIPSLVVRSNEDKYAIPQVNISELVRIKATEVSEKIDRVKNAEVLRLRGSLLPLVRLSEVLNTKSKYRSPISKELKENHRKNIADRRSSDDKALVSENDANSNQETIALEHRSHKERRQDTIAGALKIVVVEAGHMRYGLIVDELFDSKEIVVKPLGQHFKNTSCLAGATILGDGHVALILDIAGIATFTQLSMVDESDNIANVDNSSVDDSEKQSVMIFNNSEDEYFAIPTSFISRIELVGSDQIDAVGGHKVLQYRGRSLPLLSLEDYIKTKPRPENTSVYVMVFKLGGQEAGLLANSLVDIREISTHIDNVTFREPGVTGSIILDEKVIRLIDVYELAGENNIAEVQETSGASITQNGCKRILLAEDSNFFRQQLCSILEAEGYDVVDCEDGQVAWDTIQQSEEPFDLVVTDIEMPNMDGLELARHIKGDERFRDITIIAVTSLAGDEDMQRGREAGIDEYHVKLDRDELLEAVGRNMAKCRLDIT